MDRAAVFRSEQRSVAARMAIGLIVSMAVLGGGYVLGSPIATFDARLQAALPIEIGVVGWLAATVGNVARLRFFSTDDIGGSALAGGSDAIRTATAILQNTVEQVMLTVPVHLILIATFTQGAAMVAALTALFAVGRLLFWIGYRHGAAARALGFALTFYPSVLALTASACALVLS